MKPAPLVFLLCCSPAVAADHHVGPTATYATIGEAIDVAAHGDRVYVDADTYVESLVIDKDLEFFGVGTDVTHIMTPSETSIDITGVTVLFWNIHVTNSHIEVYDSDLVLEDVLVDNSSREGQQKGQGQDPNTP